MQIANSMMTDNVILHQNPKMPLWTARSTSSRHLHTKRLEKLHKSKSKSTVTNVQKLVFCDTDNVWTNLKSKYRYKSGDWWVQSNLLQIELQFPQKWQQLHVYFMIWEMDNLKDWHGNDGMGNGQQKVNLRLQNTFGSSLRHENWERSPLNTFKYLLNTF